MGNVEYLSYVGYLKAINFEKKLKILKNKYAGKKIILFGIGVLFDAITDNYNIRDYLNIVGISDKKVLEDIPSGYKDFDVYKQRTLRALDFDIILDTSVMFENTKKYLRKNYLVRKSVKIENIIQISPSEKLIKIIEKINALFFYTVTTGNIFRTLKYTFLCSADEINAKINYTKKFRALKNSQKPIRTVFVCSDTTHTDFMGLYNLLHFDKDFKLFPLILTPDNLLETEEIDEEKMKKNIEYFNTYDIKVIDGIDRSTGELPCIHAFKPDLIFYQSPILIKDDYNPLKMSEQALTFTIEYFEKNSDYTTMGSNYYRKQISNMWKVFVSNSKDKNLYAEYTNTTNKDLVAAVNKNINTGIFEYLKKCLKQH